MVASWVALPEPLTPTCGPFRPDYNPAPTSVDTEQTASNLTTKHNKLCYINTAPDTTRQVTAVGVVPACLSASWGHTHCRDNPRLFHSSCSQSGCSTAISLSEQGFPQAINCLTTLGQLWLEIYSTKGDSNGILLGLKLRQPCRLQEVTGPLTQTTHQGKPCLQGSPWLPVQHTTGFSPATKLAKETITFPQDCTSCWELLAKDTQTSSPKCTQCQ